MMESPFATTSRILAESSNAFDELRIIAGENNKLPPADRAIIRRAADDLESSYRALGLTHLQLIETQQRLIAVNDQLIQARKAALPAQPHPKWSMSTGWMRMENIR